MSILTQMQGDLANIEAQFQPIHDQYAILEKYEVPVKPDEKAHLEKLPAEWLAFQQTLVEAEKYLQEVKSKFKSDLLLSVDDFSKSAMILKDDFTVKGPFSATFGADKALKSINDYRNSIANMANQERNIQKGLAVFKLEHTPSKDIENLATDLDLLSQVWVLSQEWNAVYEEWRKKAFLTLEATEMEEVVQKFQKRLTKLAKDIKNWDVFQVFFY